jgi:hypothetical protein
MVCFEPHITRRSSNSIPYRRNKEIFHHISQPTNKTQTQSGYRTKHPATRQTKTKMAVALRPHSRKRRRGAAACSSISYSVYRRIITGWFLHTSANLEHIYLLLHCRVDCKFVKENKKNFIHRYKMVCLHVLVNKYLFCLSWTVLTVCTCHYLFMLREKSSFHSQKVLSPLFKCFPSCIRV